MLLLRHEELLQQHQHEGNPSADISVQCSELLISCMASVYVRASGCNGANARAASTSAMRVLERLLASAATSRHGSDAISSVQSVIVQSMSELTNATHPMFNGLLDLILLTTRFDSIDGNAPARGASSDAGVAASSSSFLSSTSSFAQLAPSSATKMANIETLLSIVSPLLGTLHTWPADILQQQEMHERLQTIVAHCSRLATSSTAAPSGASIMNRVIQLSLPLLQTPFEFLHLVVLDLLAQYHAQPSTFVRLSHIRFEIRL